MIPSLRTLLVAVLVLRSVECDIENISVKNETSPFEYSTQVWSDGTTETVTEEKKVIETSEATTERVLPSPDPNVRKPKNYQKYRGSVKYSTSDTKWADRVQKPFFYGKKFELRKDSISNRDQLNSSEDGKGGLITPLILSPIRTMPLNRWNTSGTDADILKQNQNDILNSVRESLAENTEGTFNITYFLEDAKESENHGGESATEYTPQKYDSPEDTGSSSRQNGDRSLMVVFPFKANEDNVEELFTKSPLIKVIHDVKRGDEILRETVPDTTGEAITSATKEETTTTTSKRADTIPRKRWQPSRRYRTSTENPVVTTTENGEDITKAYTNYNDVELVTKKYEMSTEATKPHSNHKYEPYVVTPYPIQKLLKNKTAIPSEDKTESIESWNFETEQTTESPLKVPKRKGQRRRTTTEEPAKPEDLSKVLEILPPDMKELLLQIGLNKQNKDEQTIRDNFRLEKVPQPKIDVSSYTVFKPLPLEGREGHGNFVSEDMKDFLASFGLLSTSKRIQKSLPPPPPKKETKPAEEVSDVNLDFLPDDLKLVLDEMGLLKYPDKKEPTRIHIFNPSNHSQVQSEDLEKLNAILTSIKTTVNESQSLSPEKRTEIIEKIKDLTSMRNQNGNLSDINNEIKKVLDDSKDQPGNAKPRSPTKRATKLLEGPDPLMFSEDTILKNDVKRQGTSSSSSASSSASSSGSDSSSSSASASASASGSETSASASSSAESSGEAESEATTTEEGPNIEALKESFGGGETASDDADVESSLPPRRPNGLYLLLDWNSFLEVGTEDDARRVNLRFQPKIGESRNFLPVSVP